MPVLPSDAPSREAHSRSEAYAPIEIGIVNKMPYATLRTTERQANSATSYPPRLSASRLVLGFTRCRRSRVPTPPTRTSVSPTKT